MSLSSLQPRVSFEGDLLRASYHLPHLVYTAKVYPVASPNGSTIIVYGHANGIRVLWTGGKNFKPSQPEVQEERPPPPKPQNDVVMILDSDDDEPPPKSAKNETQFKDETPQFEDEEDEIDPLSPFPATIQYLDLALGTDVLHLSFPPLAAIRPFIPSIPLSPMVSQRMILAVGCSDHTVKVITIPLLPPSPAKKRFEETRLQSRLAFPGDGTWGEEVITLGGPHGHEDIPIDVTLTLTARSASAGAGQGEDAAVPNTDEATLTSDEIQRSVPKDGTTKREQEWDLLLASVSSEASGILLVYRIPIIAASPTARLSRDHVRPIQTQYLSSPALTISFNPSPYPAKRHSHILLADSAGCLRLYDCLPDGSRSAPFSTTRPNSMIDKDILKPGQWLLSLHRGFEGVQLRRSQGSRRVADMIDIIEFLDAKWVLGGKAIVVLLSNGEWGVWDIEGAGPTAEKSRNKSELVGGKGVRGGSKAVWSLSGRMEGSRVRSQLSHSSSRKSDGSTKFVPRTPRTRKVEEQNLFGGNSIGVGSQARGGITVSITSPTNSLRAGSETIVFWFGAVFAVIPNLWSYWENQVGKSMNGGIGNLFDPEKEGQMFTLDGVHIQEGSICDIDLFQRLTGASSIGDTDRRNGPNPKSDQSRLSSSILVSGGHRIVVLSGQKSEDPSGSETFIPDDEQDMPNSQLALPGELGIDGIDRVLADMDRRETRAVARGGKHVGFVGVS